MSTAVTAAEAKEYLKLSASVNGSLIQMLLDSAEEWVQAELNVSFTKQTVVDEVAAGGNSILYLEKRPVWTVSEIVDASDDSVVDEDRYAVTPRGPQRVDHPARYMDSNRVRWENGLRRWKVSYIGGYDADTPSRVIPASVKHVVLDIFLRGWFNRGNPEMELSTGGNQQWGHIIGTDLQRRLDGLSLARIA